MRVKSPPPRCAWATFHGGFNSSPGGIGAHHVANYINYHGVALIALAECVGTEFIDKRQKQPRIPRLAALARNDRALELRVDAPGMTGRWGERTDVQLFMRHEHSSQRERHEKKMKIKWRWGVTRRIFTGYL